MNRIAEIIALLADTEQVAAMTDEQVAELRTELTDLFSTIRAGEHEEIAASDVTALGDIRDALGSITTIEGERAEAAAALEEQLAALDAEVLGSDTDPEPDADAEAETPDADPADETDPDAEPADDPEAAAEVIAEAEQITEQAAEEPEPVTAAAPAPARPPLAPARPRAAARTRPRPAQPDRPRAQMRRAVNGELAATEDAFWEQFTEAFNDAWTVPAVNAEKVRLGRITGDFPAELRFDGDGGAADLARLSALTDGIDRQSFWQDESRRALVATGGFCAPSEIDYAYAGVGSEDRPVRASLVPTNTPRGGLQTPTPVKLSDIDTSGSDAAVAQFTEAQDIAGSTKPVSRIDCGTFRESRIYAVLKRFTFGNFGQRAWPERIAEVHRVGGVAHARLAETLMLDRIKALADETLETDRVYGAARDLGEAVGRAAEAWRYRNRDHDVQLHAWFPSWVPTLGTVDLLRANQTDKTLAELQAAFRSYLNGYGVNVTFYHDSPSTGTSQAFAAEVSGTLLNAWPTAVQWGLAEEGHYLALDMGTLDLGVYRDSTLTNTNDAQSFMETFEGVHKRGVLSQWITSKICVDGSWSDGLDGTTVMACAS